MIGEFIEHDGSDDLLEEIARQAVRAADAVREGGGSPTIEQSAQSIVGHTGVNQRELADVIQRMASSECYWMQ